VAVTGRAASGGRQVDLNADLGEGTEPPPGAVTGGDPGADAGLLRLVTTAHVACGFHAGGPWVMRRTLAAAAASGVAVGAHPSYPDAGGFGREALDHPADRVADDLLYQVGALQALARAHGVAVRSVKAHGALYHRVAADPECARAVASAVRRLGHGIRLVVPAGAPTAALVEEEGVPVVHEAFCDRAYRPDGTLAPRGHDGALVTDPAEAARRAVVLATAGEVRAVDGSVLRLRCDTLCVHGDTPGVVAIAAAVRRALEQAGIRLASFAGPGDGSPPRGAPDGGGPPPG
jgi:UPF0271 protein